MLIAVMKLGTDKKKRFIAGIDFEKNSREIRYLDKAPFT